MHMHRRANVSRYHLAFDTEKLPVSSRPVTGPIVQTYERSLSQSAGSEATFPPVPARTAFQPMSGPL